MAKLLRKFFAFAMISGVGWLIDFGIFYGSTAFLGLPVIPANFISSFFAVSFVFLVSTRKLLALRQDGLRVQTKYLIYLVYQLLLLSIVSLAAQLLYRWLGDLSLVQSYPLLRDNTKLLAKILITPITMVCNFIVMRFLTERL